MREVSHLTLAALLLRIITKELPKLFPEISRSDHVVSQCLEYILTIPEILQPEEKHLLLSLYILVEKTH